VLNKIAQMQLRIKLVPSCIRSYTVRANQCININVNNHLFILFIYYKIVRTVPDRQNRQSNIKWYKSEVKVK